MGRSVGRIHPELAASGYAACTTWLSGVLLLSLLAADFFWVTRSWDRTRADIFPLWQGEHSPDDELGIIQPFFVWPATQFLRLLTWSQRSTLVRPETRAFARIPPLIVPRHERGVWQVVQPPALCAPSASFLFRRLPDRAIVVGRIELGPECAPSTVLDLEIHVAQLGGRKAQSDHLPNAHQNPFGVPPPQRHR